MPQEPSPSKRFHDVRMRGFRDRTEVEAALELLRARISPLEAERVPLAQAAGRVLAAPVIAGVDVPAFDRAAMDGFALRGEETFGASPYDPLVLKVIGEARPGRPFAGAVESGQSVRIMTGAPIPSGVDAVLPAELAEEQAGQVRISESVPPGRHIGRRGEDIQQGTTVVSAGRALRPQDLGVLAAIGHGTVAVHRRPRVRLVITGDELLPPGSQPQGCMIVDSNSIMLRALVDRDGGIPSQGPIVPDRRDEVQAAILGTDAEVILVSGGSSVGAEDHAPCVVAEAGELPVHGIAMRPSSPTGIGFLGGRPVFLLPGNPVSCLAAYEFFAGPAIRRLGGRSMDWPHRRTRQKLAQKLVSAVGRVDYVRVRIGAGGVVPIATSGASILSSTTFADGFVIVPRDSEGYASGETVEVFLYDG